jgi:cytochrome b561
MGLKDSTNHYGGVSRFNHWISALLVIGMLAVGFYFNDMPRGDEKSYWLKMHIGVGGLIFVFLWFRVLWRIIVKSPAPVEQEKALHVISQLVHWILLLSVLVMAISGPMLIWTRGADINVFGWFAIPTPIGEMHDLHELMEEVHEIAAKVLFVTILLHVAAAIKHQFINKNQVLARMIKRLR